MSLEYLYAQAAVDEHRQRVSDREMRRRAQRRRAHEADRARRRQRWAEKARALLGRLPVPAVRPPARWRGDGGRVRAG
jgi:hypothetical protein